MAVHRYNQPSNRSSSSSGARTSSAKKVSGSAGNYTVVSGGRTLGRVVKLADGRWMGYLGNQPCMKQGSRTRRGARAAVLKAANGRR